MTLQPMTLVVNPGSASRKYALYKDGRKRADLWFEYIDGQVEGRLEFDGNKHIIKYPDADLGIVSRYIVPIFIDYGVIHHPTDISVIGIRVVAPSRRFLQDELITPSIEAVLVSLQELVPLHVTTLLNEIAEIKLNLYGIPMIAISDSAFHSTKPTWAWDYGIDPELADRYDIKRFGYHGISVGSIVRKMRHLDIIHPKMIVCHLGSGSSVTAVYNGDSLDTTMGYTPLEGLMMASRSGSMDVVAALAIKRALKISDIELENYLNTKCGLLGVSGESNDIRKLLELEEKGDDRASLALKLYVYHVQQAIGQMTASMGGVDVIVFTGTIGERSAIIRSRILDDMQYLGFKYNHNSNVKVYEPKEPINIAISGSRRKPIYVISTDESIEIARRAEQYLDGQY